LPTFCGILEKVFPLRYIYYSLPRKRRGFGDATGDSFSRVLVNLRLWHNSAVGQESSVEKQGNLRK
jgi:hypothetical protein